MRGWEAGFAHKKTAKAVGPLAVIILAKRRDVKRRYGLDVPASDQADEYRDYRQDEQNVNEAAEGIGCNQPDSPEHQ